MCCNERKISVLIEAGHDLVASIKNANWGTIRHQTIHMEQAVAMWELQTHKWEEDLCPSRRKKLEI